MQVYEIKKNKNKSKGKHMYYPKQIPYLLDKKFNKNIEYKEYNLKELEDYCMCIWTMQSKKTLDKTIYNYILPDACIDIVVNFSDRTICFAGFSKETIPFELHQKIDFMGVRLKPSAFYILFGIGSDKIMDHPIPFSELENKNKLEEILNITDTNERLTIFKKYLLEKTKEKPSIKSIKFIETLYNNPKEQTVMDLAKKYGYNERNLYRIFKTNYGISPKVLLNILRLHLCLTLMIDNKMNCMDIAQICGFYDQSHFIKEIKRYTGFSPLQLLERYK